VHVIAEESTAWPRVSRPVHHGGLGFGMKWNMGWMNDTLRYFARPHFYRRWHGDDIRFSRSMPSTRTSSCRSRTTRWCTARAACWASSPATSGSVRGPAGLYGLMWAHPGKKLLFMGGEFGQRRRQSVCITLPPLVHADPGAPSLMKNIFSTIPPAVARPPTPDIDPGRRRRRAVIDAVLPCVDNGRFPVKCVAGERVAVRRIASPTGTTCCACSCAGVRTSRKEFREVPMKPLGNDVWEAAFSPPALGRYVYTVVAWVDPFESWRSEMTRRVDPDDVRIAAQVGALEIAAAAARAEGADRTALQRWATELDASGGHARRRHHVAEGAGARRRIRRHLARRHPDRRHAVRHPVELPLVADRERARFSTWYELFPRSAGAEPGVHGTFKDVEARLPAIAAMGFDVLYFPPIHPVGRMQRKGPNNALSRPRRRGQPVGHRRGRGRAQVDPAGARHPEDFRHLLARAAEHGLEIALDIAFQCAPDHPYVKAHPDWFRWRPDGTVQYAENPPKKYQDIYPFNFESEDWRGLWAELKSVFDHWIGEGVRIFRVDNPHTKAFPFWEWVIGEVKREHPDAIFLAEAFTRPKVMHRLAKLGFSQSYTYFTWRNTKEELEEYFTELSSGPGIDYFRPNAWPNTPDILHEQLQTGEPAVYMSRLVLAATLAANYGIYGPAYELREHLPRGPAARNTSTPRSTSCATGTTTTPRASRPSSRG
jgi:starch synthase (maltosyl-transferring)